MSTERRPAKLAITNLRKDLDNMMNVPEEKEILGGLLAPRQKKTVPEETISNETQRVLGYMKAIRESGVV